jgi:hypothetical protein
MKLAWVLLVCAAGAALGQHADFSPAGGGVVRALTAEEQAMVDAPKSITATNYYFIGTDDNGDVIAFRPGGEEAAKAARVSLRQDLATVRTNVAAMIEISNGNIIDAKAIAVNNSSTTAQVRSAVIYTQKEVEDLAQQLKQTQQEVQALRRVVSQMVKQAE